LLCVLDDRGQFYRLECSAPSANDHSKDENIDYSPWFTRANTQLNLRLPGAAPFQLRVSFHALPGEEVLAPKQAPEILTGDGEYDEIWVAPHQWRREVRLGTYHAVETESAQGRKWTASSDYEPGRILMLLDALLYPLPKYDEQANELHLRWLDEKIAVGGVSLVRVSRTAALPGTAINSAYFFTPKGLLLMRNEFGLITQWTNYAIFAGRLIPKHLDIKAGDRELLTADVAITSFPEAPTSLFDLPGGFATPSQTIRPLESFAKGQRPVDKLPDESAFDSAATTFWAVIDRDGRYREFEVVQSLGRKTIQEYLQLFRRYRWHPATIDGEPCEVGGVGMVGQSVQIR
jgi:hypothetical protein